MYYLYRDDEPVIKIVEKNDYIEVHNILGAFFSEAMKEMSKEDMLRFKAVHNLNFEHEINAQKTIFDF